MSIDIKNLKIAKRYSHALIESVSNSIDESLKDLFEINELIKSNIEFKTFFKHPSVSLQDKKDTINELFSSKINQKILDFLNVLLDESRFDLLNTIYDLFEKECQKIKNQQTVNVISAVELNDEDKKRIGEKLKEKINKEIILDCKLEENILGGLVFKIDDKVIDLSIKKKFDNLRKCN